MNPHAWQTAFIYWNGATVLQIDMIFSEACFHDMQQRIDTDKNEMDLCILHTSMSYIKDCEYNLIISIKQHLL